MTAGDVMLIAASGVDDAQLSFNDSTILLLNVILGLVMFGVALDIQVSDLRQLLRTPRPALVGLAAQFAVLPALTFLLTQLLDPEPSIALGMILVGASPGGNISNFIAHFARGNTMLSIGMTGVSTLAAIAFTPLNFSFWGSLDPDTDAILHSVSLDPAELALTISLLLGLPVALGMTLRARRPDLAARLRGPMRSGSMVFFLLFVLLALAANFQNFLDYVGLVAGAVFLHNAVALSSGYAAAAAFRLPERDRRAVSIEVGIQNSALSLALIFSFFDGLGGMALVAAWWGIWHIVAGMSLAWFWSRRPPAAVPEAAIGRGAA